MPVEPPPAASYTPARLHWVKHMFHCQPIEIVSDWDGGDLYIGARCLECGNESGWHKSRVKRTTP